MIRYTLRCSCGHEFEQWFDNMADYDHRKETSALSCPECQGHEVGKAIMAPNVGKSKSAPAPAMPSCAQQGCSSGMCPMMQGAF